MRSAFNDLEEDDREQDGSLVTLGGIDYPYGEIGDHGDGAGPAR